MARARDLPRVRREPILHRSLRARGFKTAAAAIFIAGILSGCSNASGLEAEMKAAVNGSDDAFSLESLDAVRGAEFLVVCPYESKASVQDRLGFEWGASPDYSQADDRQTIVIVDRGEVVSHAEVQRDEVDFCAGDGWRLLPVETGLEVARSGNTALVSKRGA
jgi:hypothetical protein